MTFRAILDDPVMLGGNVVIPRNAAVVLQAAKVEQAGNFKGADKITLKANSMSFGGRKYDIVTSYVEQKGSGETKKTRRKVIGGAGLGRCRRRHRRRWHRRGHRCRGGNSDRRDHRQPGDRALDASGRDAAAIHIERRRHRATVNAIGFTSLDATRRQDCSGSSRRQWCWSALQGPSRERRRPD